MPTEAGNYSRAGTAPRKPVTTAVRCKVCGYITDASKVGDRCPVCGVKAAMFEPLTERFSDDRRRFLDLHIHPILAHFPQAFSVTILLLAMVRPVLSDAAGRVAADALLVLALALPFTLIGAFVSGLLDGRMRFKKLNAPYLQIKQRVGGAYLLLSVLFAAMVMKGTCAGQPVSAALGIVTAAGLVICTLILGNIGSRLGCCRLPG
jgi:rubredoxin